MGNYFIICSELTIKYLTFVTHLSYLYHYVEPSLQQMRFFIV